MKILAVDYGDARTGLAACDRTEFLASPLGVIQEKSLAKTAEKIVYAVREYDIGLVVVGLPRNMDGTEGPRAEKCRRVAALLQTVCGVPVCLWDERRTTVTAAGILADNNVYGDKRRRQLDAVAAQVILEGFLAWRRNHPGELPQA